MKIAFIGQKGIPSISGGVEKHVEDLATSLVKAGHEVLVYTRPNYTSKKLKNFQGVKLISLPSLGTKHLDAISHTILACLDVIFKREVDIIHFHSIGPSSLIWLVKLLKPKTPVIATYHSQCYFHKKWGSLARLYLKFGEYMCLKLADQVISVSESLKNYAEEKYSRVTACIPNGIIMPKNLRADKIKKWGLEKDNYIVAISRLVQHKGIPYLINAYQALNTDKKLVIVGDGAYTDNYVKFLKELAANNKNIIFTGPQTGDTLKELFFNAYLFVQPSESEGLSIALLEAMSYGRGALVSSITENKEVIKDNNFIFKNKSVISLTYKLNNLLNNKELVKEAGVTNKVNVKENYNWQKKVKDVINIYNHALNYKEEEVYKFRLVKIYK
ncbi:MAG: glycosyltransferase family 4 protein [Patescibacteria group bacterium]